MSTDLVTAEASDPLNQAVSRMLDRDVGCIVVTEKGNVVGIITKGDVLKKAFLKGIEASKFLARKVMSGPVVTVNYDSTLEEAAKIMTLNRISKLPVLKGNKLVGIVTSTDVIRAEPTQVGYLQELVRARFVPHDLR
jgi:CBS domain-containing protein